MHAGSLQRHNPHSDLSHCITVYDQYEWILQTICNSFFAIFLTINVSFGNSKSDILCSESEKQARLNFKQDLVDPSNVLVSWVVEDDCCNWAGIHCHNLTGYVEKINLASAGGRLVLKGKVNPSLLNLNISLTQILATMILVAFKFPALQVLLQI